MRFLVAVAAWALVAVAIASPGYTQVQPADAGVVLCSSPVIANNFYSDLKSAADAGVRLDHAQVLNVARKNECGYVISSKLRPIDFVAGALAVTDGKATGWVSTYIYIRYINGRQAFR